MRLRWRQHEPISKKTRIASEIIGIKFTLLILILIIGFTVGYVSSQFSKLEKRVKKIEVRNDYSNTERDK